MKKYILTIVVILSALGAQAQSRKYIANFSLFQQYYNPALTGYEGSMVKTFYRNQWAGFEQAPTTLFASGEVDLADLAAWKKDDLLKTRLQEGYDRQLEAKHAFGLAVLHDQFGAFTERQLFLSYASRVRLSERQSLRLGSAVTYSGQRLDGNRLTVDQEYDPRYQEVLGNKSGGSKFDLNLGLMLTADQYYLGYAMQDATKAGFLTSGNGVLETSYTRKHVLQAGYRTAVSDQLGLVTNALYQYDGQVAGTVEGQLKAVYQNMFWIGGAYRKDLAYSLTTGLRLDQLKVGFVYEMPSGDARAINKTTHEISLTYNLVKVKYPKFGRTVTIW